jgi:hypothetical protein
MEMGVAMMLVADFDGQMHFVGNRISKTEALRIVRQAAEDFEDMIVEEVPE